MSSRHRRRTHSDTAHVYKSGRFYLLATWRTPDQSFKFSERSSDARDALPNQMRALAPSSTTSARRCRVMRHERIAWDACYIL